ncbi:G2/mitotic-specific cyclin-B [Phthorimaea operculella]|nr:G2/mitotic-specific cyclin-B [Phthorimaea operculella]
MEIHTRRHHTIQDQENIYAVKGKTNTTGLPVKRQGLGVRGALGDVNTNVQAQRDVNVGKVAVAAAEFEKKATLNRGPLKSNYGHVTSRVDTGLVSKPIQPAARPPLRREESTAGLAARAVARTRAVLKDQNKTVKAKTDSSSSLVAKKVTTEAKKTIKISKDQPKVKESKESSKVIIKDPVESLGKLKLSEKSCEIPKSPVIKLPDDIEDIDAGDNNPLVVSIYIKDIYDYLRQLELQFPIEEDYLKKQAVITGKMRATLMDWLVEVQRQFSLVLETFQLTVGIIDRYLQAVITGKMRATLMDWLVEVQRQFSLVLETFQLTVGIIDRYLQIVPNVQRDRLQLIGVTAMYIASKYEEIYAPDVGDFVYVTASAYTKADVFQCEREMLQKLNFCLAKPIPLSFLRRFVKAAHGTSKQHHLAKYLVDLCLVEYSMAHYYPSELAAAAICLSQHLSLNKPFEDVWTPTLAYYSGYTLEHIRPIIRKIAKIVGNVENSKCQAVYNKYTDISLARVALSSSLKGDAIRQIAEAPESSDL